MNLHIASLLSFFLFLGLAANSPQRKKVRVKTSATAPLMGNMYEEIDEIQPGGKIYGDHFYVSNPTLIKKLGSAAQRGVEVQLNTSKRTPLPSVKSLRDKGVHVASPKKGLHTKRFCFEQPDGSCKVIEGSRNAANIFRHQEIQTVTEDPDYYQQAKDDHELNKDLRSPVRTKTKPILKITPKNKKVASSQLYDVMESKAKRILTMAEDSDGDDDFLDVDSMTFDAKPIVHSVEQVKKKRPNLPVRFFLDASATKRPKQLDRLENAGAQVYIYNEDKTETQGKIPSLQHQKSMIRRTKGRPDLAIISSGNLTPQSGHEMNADAIFPDDADLVDEIKKHNDALQKKSKRWKKNAAQAVRNMR